MKHSLQLFALVVGSWILGAAITTGILYETESGGSHLRLADDGEMAGPCPGPGPCPRPSPGPRPQPQPQPSPAPGPQPAPNPNVQPGEPVVGGEVSPDGAEEMQVVMPESERVKNCGGRDGAGLCVFTSIMCSARWQNERALFEFQKMMRQETGGGWPARVDQMLKKYSPQTRYIQSTTGDVELLRKALRSGRMPAVTWSGQDPQNNFQRICHMVNITHLSERWAAVADNNFIGRNQYVWSSPAAFEKRWKSFGEGWTVILLNPAPAPPPRR